MPGKLEVTPATGQTIGMDNAISTNNNPYSLDWPESVATPHTATSSLPASNYSAGVTLCQNDSSDACHNTQTIEMLGNPPGKLFTSSPNARADSGQFTDIRWYYWHYPGWYKLKRASFHKLSNTPLLANYIPPGVTQYDSFDTDQPMLIIDEADLSEGRGIGVLTTQTTLDLGPNQGVAGSVKRWGRSNYSWGDRGYLNAGGLQSFIQYVRAKKDVAIIYDGSVGPGAPPGMSGFQGDRINLYDPPGGNVTVVVNDWVLSGGATPQGRTTTPAVLLVNGNVRIESFGQPKVNNARRPLAIIATGEISVDTDVEEINAILIANSFDLALGSSRSTTPLKIVGNLISVNPVATQKRYRPEGEYQRPSLYVVFHPEFYMRLLPYLSTIVTEGRVD